MASVDPACAPTRPPMHRSSGAGRGALARAAAGPSWWLVAVAALIIGVGVAATVLTVGGAGAPTAARAAGPAATAASGGRAGRAASPTSPGEAPGTAPGVERAGAGVSPQAVLARWDARRALAWAHDDVRGLRRIYAPGSGAGAHDVAMLVRWRDRGLAVRHLATQLVALHVIAAAPDRLVLLVTDRVVGARAVGVRAVGGERPRPLPEDRPTTRRLVLVRSVGGPWRMASVR